MMPSKKEPRRRSSTMQREGNNNNLPCEWFIALGSTTTQFVPLLVMMMIAMNRAVAEKLNPQGQNRITCLSRRFCRVHLCHVDVMRAGGGVVGENYAYVIYI
jgi:hypothetical protein